MQTESDARFRVTVEFGPVRFATFAYNSLSHMKHFCYSGGWRTSPIADDSTKDMYGKFWPCGFGVMIFDGSLYVGHFDSCEAYAASAQRQGGCGCTRERVLGSDSKTSLAPPASSGMR